MAQRERDDPERMEYVLPEDGHRRLEKLRDHMVLLSRLARPRTEHEWVPDICMAELSVCLEMLAEQADRVLEHIDWRPVEPVTGSASGHGMGTPSGPGGDGAGEGGCVVGVSLEQVDALDHLVVRLSALADVVATADPGELAQGTLPSLGYAMLEAVAQVREVLRQVEGQRLRGRGTSRTPVREGRAVYALRHHADARGGARLPRHRHPPPASLPGPVRG